MKSVWKNISLIIVALIGAAAPAVAQNTLGRLEAEIRQANGQPQPAAATGQRVYLGAIANDDAGRGVRITSVRVGGPAERGGLRAQDIVVGAAGSRIHLLSELTAILGNMNPGDRLALEIMRGTRPLRVEIVLASPPGSMPHLAERPTTPPATGLGAGRTESIPPPPGEVGEPLVPPVPSGPALEVPSQPVPPNSPQGQIEELRHRVDQLEHRVKELEQALADSQKK